MRLISNLSEVIKMQLGESRGVSGGIHIPVLYLHIYLVFFPPHHAHVPDNILKGQ